MKGEGSNLLKSYSHSNNVNRVSIISCCQRSTGQTGNNLLLYQRHLLPSNHYNMSMWFDYCGCSDYVLYKNMSTSGSTTQIRAMSSIRHVSKLLPSTL